MGKGQCNDCLSMVAIRVAFSVVCLTGDTFATVFLFRHKRVSFLRNQRCCFDPVPFLGVFSEALVAFIITWLNFSRVTKISPHSCVS
jgi:hypothetical protein